VPLRIERSRMPADYDVLVGELAQARGDFEAARAAYERAAQKDPDSGFLHDRLARLAWQLDDVEGALREAELAFALDPESRRSRLFLGRLYRLRRDFEGLDRVLRDEAGAPLDADSAHALYQVAMERGDLEEAEALAKRLAELEPDQLRGILALASVHEQRRDWDAAIAVVRKGLESFPDHFLLFMRLAQIERARSDRAGEIAIYPQRLESHPNHYGILDRLGQAQLEAEDVDGAIETYQRIVEAYPDELNALRRLAQLEFSEGRYADAARRLEAVLARDPDQPQVAFALGQILNATGDTPGAIAAYERIGPDDPGHADARLQIVGLLEAEGRLEEALAETERLRALRPHRQLDFHAAALRVQLGDFDGGVALLESLLDGSDADAEVFFQLGAHYGTAGRHDEAIRWMQRVLEIAPDDANALNYIGYSWADRGERLAEAESMIRRALEVSPDDGFITDSLGWVFYRQAEQAMSASRRDEAMGLLEQAREALVRAAELTGGDPVVAEHLGDVMRLSGDESAALDYYEEAVELGVRESEQPDLLDKLEALRRKLGRTPPAGEES